MCGENTAGQSFRPLYLGSSPRVRGKLPSNHWAAKSRGLIPACAGKTYFARWSYSYGPAHPRVCGENFTGNLTSQSIEGSSPRVRGKRPGRTGRPGRNRLIPACAGKTPSPLLNTSPWRAHPRVCGENRMEAKQVVTNLGSSPRVRGKHPAGLAGDLVGRLIPACAGKTHGGIEDFTGLRAHPRVCGENEFAGDFTGRNEGSSPRVRGKRDT